MIVHLCKCIFVLDYPDAKKLKEFERQKKKHEVHIYSVMDHAKT